MSEVMVKFVSLDVNSLLGGSMCCARKCDPNDRRWITVALSCLRITCLIVYHVCNCRVITKLSTGGLWEFLYMRWPLDIRHSLLINRFKSMKRLFLERSVRSVFIFWCWTGSSEAVMFSSCYRPIFLYLSPAFRVFIRLCYLSKCFHVFLTCQYCLIDYYKP